MSQFLKTKKEIQKWLDDMNIEKYEIKTNKKNELIVNVNSNVDISYQNLEFIPVRFNKVDGYFFCYCNKLKTLNGAPKKVNSFDCSHNKLTSLYGAPKKVNSFDCSYNNLTSLEGATKEVNGFFNCSSNKLTSLDGSPKKNNGYFDCEFNYNLKYIKDLPKARTYFFKSTLFSNLTKEELIQESQNQRIIYEKQMLEKEIKPVLKEEKSRIFKI